VVISKDSINLKIKPSFEVVIKGDTGDESIKMTLQEITITLSLTKNTLKDKKDLETYIKTSYDITPELSILALDTFEGSNDLKDALTSLLNMVNMMIPLR